MKLKINGKPKEFNLDRLSISELLKIEKVMEPEMVTVQRNGAFAERKDFETTLLSDGDEIDFLYFMGGGA